jgi:hypothetical protein
MQPIEDVIAALNATSLAQPPAPWWRSSVGPTNYSEDFWRKDALEKLVYAATAFRLGIYSAEELEIAENRARFFLARWSLPATEPVPVAERPWEREGWCDAKGECYAWDGNYWWMVGGRWWERQSDEPFTHSLPHHALPVPGAEVG